MKLYKRFKNWILRKKPHECMADLSDEEVIEHYVYAGKYHGDGLSMVGVAGFLGCTVVGLHESEKKLELWEAEYIKRGYVPISLDDFYEAVGWNKDISHLIGVKQQCQKD